MTEQLAIQNKLAYMDSLSRANGEGHKVDKELQEIVQLLREDLGIADKAAKFAAEVKRAAKSETQRLTLRYIKKLQDEDVINFRQADKAREEIWNIKNE